MDLRVYVLLFPSALKEVYEQEYVRQVLYDFVGLALKL